MKHGFVDTMMALAIWGTLGMALLGTMLALLAQLLPSTAARLPTPDRRAPRPHRQASPGRPVCVPRRSCVPACAAHELVAAC